MSDTVRVACVHEDCGTFPMDRALYDRLKRTRESFTCPNGHEQHFTETQTSELKQQVERLQSNLTAKDETIADLRERIEREQDRKRNMMDRALDAERDWRHARDRLLDATSGVVEVAPETWMWACECGSRGRKQFSEPDEAREHHERHVRRNCEVVTTEETTDA